MSKTRQEKRSKIKPFIKVINYNHLMPTRYTLELEGLKGVVTSDTFKEVSQREEAKKNVKKVLEERYTSGKNRWFFTPLSMCAMTLGWWHLKADLRFQGSDHFLHGSVWELSRLVNSISRHLRLG
jgi:large subunit ribosomal protein L27e